MLEVVIFDMDGVVIDSETLHFVNFKGFCKEKGLKIPDEEYHKFIGSSDVQLWGKFKQDYNMPQTLESIIEEYTERYHQCLRKEKDVKPISGVDILIKELYEKGVRLALASSAARKTIEIVLEQFKIKQYFEVSVSGHEVKSSKPAPDIFIRTAELMRANTEMCIVIEDSRNGVRAAKAAKMKCIGYHNPNFDKQDLSLADMTVSGFEDLNYEKLQKLFEI